MSPSVRPSSSRAPAGLPPSGNAKYVVVVVLLIAGIVGLLLFKKCGSDGADQTRAFVPIDAAPTPHDNPDDKLPPPPPEEVVVDSGPVQKATTAAAANDPCAAKTCNGSTTPDLESALAFRAKQAHRCYDQALAQDSTLKGRIGISVRVAFGGQVCRADVASNDMGTNQVAQCVVNMFRQSGHFPPPKGGCVDATVPISFVAGGK
jgi:hypothetical protein